MKYLESIFWSRIVKEERMTKDDIDLIEDMMCLYFEDGDFRNDFKRVYDTRTKKLLNYFYISSYQNNDWSFEDGNGIGAKGIGIVLWTNEQDKMRTSLNKLKNRLISSGFEVKIDRDLNISGVDYDEVVKAGKNKGMIMSGYYMRKEYRINIRK